jgi:uncharacterized protein YcbK (DUF882 family)
MMDVKRATAKIEDSVLRPGRRMALRAAAGLIATAALPLSARATNFARTLKGREISLLNLHTGEKLKAEYWHNGRYVPDALRSISVVLRDYRNNKVHPIDPRLLDLINTLHVQLGAVGAFNVISGYRSPETNAMMHEASAGVAAHSLHMEGMAIDIRLPGFRLSALKNAAMKLGAGGVGYYSTDDFVHVDVGPVRHWGG